MSNEPPHDEPTGAIDEPFAANEREARDQITDKLAEYNRGVEAYGVAIDLVYHRPVFVRKQVADTCVAYWEDGEDFDITTYKSHPYLPITADDAVFECVYIPTKPGDIRHDAGDRTYDFPTGRLARVPLENLWDSATRPQDDFRAAMLAALLATADDHPDHGGGVAGAVLAVAEDVFADAVIDDALRRAGLEDWVVDEDTDE